MERPTIWVSKSDDNRFRFELSRDGHKLCDMDRLDRVAFIRQLSSLLLVADENPRVTHDVVFQGIPLPELTQVDIGNMIAQASLSLLWEVVT